MASHKPSTSNDDSGVSRLGRTLIETEVLMLLGLLGFVGLAFLAERVLGLSEALALGSLPAIAISAIPALLWLGYFYRQDRVEPEPHQFVFGLFLLGGFVAAPLAGFLVERVAAGRVIGVSLNALAPERLVMAFLVIAAAQELSKYVVVRYTMYINREFDEPLDGIVYATAVGVGFATYENIHFFGQAGNEVLISAAAATTVVTTLAHACFAGVTGYALGRAKFGASGPTQRSLWLIGGLLGATILNGGFRVLSDRVGAGQMAHEPWRPVAFTFGFAVVIFFVVSLMARQLLALSPHVDAEGDGGDES